MKRALIIAALVLIAVIVPLAGNVRTAHAATITCPATIQEGSTGSLVKQLQTELNYVSFAALSVDGDFGPATQAATINFQKFAFPNGTSSTEWNGRVGPHTWGVLGMCHSSGGVSGGGCTTGAVLEACISVGSGKVLPDAYVSSGFTIVYIYLVEDGNGSHAHIEDMQNPFPDDNSLYGYEPSISSGYSWVTMDQGLEGSTWYETVSPPQYT